MARIDLPPGDQLDVVKALTLRPGLAKAVAIMNNAVDNSGLDWRLHELLRMRIALINGCRTCLAWRTPQALAAGVTEELLGAVDNWRASDLFTDRERVVLDFTEQFCGNSAAISDELLGKLSSYFDSGEIVELSLVIGKYLSQGRFMQVLGLDVCSIDLAPAPA